jgi:hypothetical protein
VRRFVVTSIVLLRVKLLEEEHFGEKVVLNAKFDYARPVVSHVLDPLCLRSDLFFQLSVLLLDTLGMNADKVLKFDQNASEEPKIVATLTKANHSSKHVVL